MAVEADVLRVFDEAAGLGPVSHVVNNAGITGQSSRLEAASLETIRACIERERHGRDPGGARGGPAPAQAQRRAGRGDRQYLVGRRDPGISGRICLVRGLQGRDRPLTIGLAKELATDGVRVNAVSPGMVDTEIHALSTGDPGRVERIAPLIPLQRVGQADEIAHAVLFLLSEEASYITGATLRVRADGSFESGGPGRRAALVASGLEVKPWPIATSCRDRRQVGEQVRVLLHHASGCASARCAC